MGDGMFERFGAVCAVLSGLAGLGYSAAFVVYLHNASRGAVYADSLLLLAGGIFSTVTFVAVYGRLRATDEGFALLGLLFAFAGAFGAMTHGAYDLANLVKPPATLASDLPSSTDPRGLGTFALTGVAFAIVGALVVRSRAFPVGLGYLALLAAALLVFVYVGRLVILDPKSPGLHAAAVVAGFVVNPAFLIWLGSQLWRRAPQAGAIVGA